MEFYSQFKEDTKKGFYVDIGVHGDISGSNTYFFEKLNWDGVYINENGVYINEKNMLL